MPLLPGTSSQITPNFNWLEWLPIIINIAALLVGLFIYKKHQKHQLKISAKYEAFKSFFVKSRIVSDLISEILVDLNFIKEWNPTPELLKKHKTLFIQNNLIPLLKAFPNYYDEFALWECFLFPLNKVKSELFKSHESFSKKLGSYLHGELNQLPTEDLIDETLKMIAFIEDAYKLVYNTLLAKEFGYEMRFRLPNQIGIPVLTKDGIKISE